MGGFRMTGMVADTPARTDTDGPTGETQLDIANQGADDDQPETDPVQDELRRCLDEYYWCKPTVECIQSLVRKTSEYYEYCNATGKMAMWRMVFEQYNRGYITLGSVSRGGVEGELLNLPINEFRNIIDHVVGLTTQDKLAFEPQPVNNDYTTAAQVTLAKGILNDYARNKGMDRTCDQNAENAYLFGEGTTVKLFNENLGDLKFVDTTAQKIYRKGDIQFLDVNPTNLIRDIHIQQFKDNQWFIVRLFVNKYDLAAQYPDKAKDICEKSISTDWDNTRITATRGEKSDLIPLFLAFHKQTSSLPFGRQLVYLDSDTWLEDEHLEYREFPIYTNMPAPVDSINFGYTVAFDLLPLQQVLDIIDGGHATNLSNFLVSNILVPDGCNLGIADLIGSMNLLKYNAQAGEPKALNLVLFPPEGPTFRAFVVQRMETLAGVNAQLRGMTDENITSGSQSALQDARAIRFNSRFAKSWAFYCGQLASGILYDLQDHPEDARTGLVAGKGNRCYMKEFYGSGVNLIDRVTVQLGSAYANTEAGKIEMAKDMVGAGMISDPKEYLEVVETGQLEALTEGPHRELMLIKGENEKLSEGGMAKAAISDDHPTHILEHKNVIADPSIRLANDPKAATIVQNTLTHIAEHEQLMQQCIQTRPILAGVLKFLPQGPAAPPPPNAPRPPMPQKKALPPGANTRPPVKPPVPGAPLHAQGPAMKRKVPMKPGMQNTVAVQPPASNPAPQGAIHA
jgi:hypothetical protein